MTDKRTLKWVDVEYQCRQIEQRWRNNPAVTQVYGVPRGGTVPASIVAQELHLVQVFRPEQVNAETLVIDDLVDSGATAKRFLASGVRAFDALFRKSVSPAGVAARALQVDEWLVFPWEEGDDTNGPADAVRRLLQFVGENPDREGLLDTPARVLRSFTEMCSGYTVDVPALLARNFESDGYNGMVVSTGIDFTSTCEHHLLPFVGVATVGYIPGASTPETEHRVVGLSKLARVVDAYARRLQVQERMTNQIADALQDELSPQGVGVVLRAHHACMGCRGVRKANAEMVTSSLRGLMYDQDRARAEFLALAGIG